MVKAFAEALMGAGADAARGAPYGQVSEARVNYRNGYRDRRWDTRTGTIGLAIPRLRAGSCFREWLLERRRRSEQALVSVVAASYLLGVSTRRVEKLAETLGIKSLFKSQVSELAKSLDGAVEQFRCRPVDVGPYPGNQAACTLTLMNTYAAQVAAQLPAGLPTRMLLILATGAGVLALLVYIGIALPAVWPAKPARRKAAAEALAQILAIFQLRKSHM